jgi:hypothetical protein
MIQEIIVGICIVLAAVYIVRRIRKSFTRKGGCNCGKSDCPYKGRKNNCERTSKKEPPTV